MTNKHAKCPRCNQRGIKWGQRRRHCSHCKITWRIRKKRRGRKSFRSSSYQATQYVVKQKQMICRGRKVNFYRQAISRDVLRRQSWPELPQSEPLILIADAFLKYTEHSWRTWYCILARPINSDDAIILQPYCRKGTEVALGWQEAFDQLPKTILKRVKTLVSDGHIGLILEVRHRRWLIQRCHFHLIARLQQRRSRWPRGFHKEEAKQIYQLAKKILETKHHKTLKEALRQLEYLGQKTTSRDVRRMISGLLTNYEDYRTYLRYPELHLPTTSNTAEALVGSIKKLCRQANGFRTVQSLNKWIEALIKVKKSIKCRSKTNQII